MLPCWLKVSSSDTVFLFFLMIYYILMAHLSFPCPWSTILGILDLGLPLLLASVRELAQQRLWGSCGVSRTEKETRGDGAKCPLNSREKKQTCFMYHTNRCTFQRKKRKLLTRKHEKKKKTNVNWTWREPLILFISSISSPKDLNNGGYRTISSTPTTTLAGPTWKQCHELIIKAWRARFKG